MLQLSMKGVCNRSQVSTEEEDFGLDGVALVNEKRRRSNVVEKFREVSDSVWVSLKAVIIEKTLKEEWTKKNNSNDNYN